MAIAENSGAMSTVQGAEVVDRRAVRSALSRPLRQLLRNKLGVAGIAVLLFFIVVALFAKQLELRDPLETDVAHAVQPPSLQQPFGTDRLGRDVYSRVVAAARVSLVLPVISVLLGLSFGGTLGLISGYLEGWWDILISRAMDIILGLPILVFAIVVVAFLGPGVNNTILAITVIFIPLFARVTQAPVLAEKNREYVIAATSIGAGRAWIVLRHILPNIISPVLIMGTLQMASAILIEASISFLGLGTTPDDPSWGRMLFDNYPLLERAPWASIFPGLAIVLVVIAFNFVGDAVRDALDPTLI
jgi:peptide/nickel transport system permease protein